MTSKLSAYTFIKFLGKGSFGTVGLYSKNKSKYVIKNIAGSAGKSMNYSERFIPWLVKVMTPNHLCHENIVCMLDFFTESNGNLYLVYEYVEGIDLFNWTLKNPAPSTASLFLVKLGISKDIVSAVSYLHIKSIAHRDIKPQNIIIGTNFRAILADFGFACLENVIKNKTYRALFKDEELVYIMCDDVPKYIGTPRFIPPELETKKGFISYQVCDVYSLGKTLEFLFAGEHGIPILDRCISSMINPNPVLRTSAQACLDIINEILHHINAKK